MNAIRTAPLVLLLSATLHAQSNIDPAHKFSWQENTGWINWRDAGMPRGAQGVRVQGAFLSGFAWSENAGYISFGDGTPGGGSAYTNASGADHGVNILAGGDLAGFAWGENTGWINFGTSGLGSQRARLDAAALRLRGWAWGENIGWVNLDNAAHFVGLSTGLCYANCDGSTAVPVLNVNDFICFNNRFAAADPYANCDGSTAAPVLNVNDFTCFLNRYATGCS